MSKLGCTCGHTIRDQTDNLPYKGHILKDQDIDSFFDRVTTDLAHHIREALAGRRDGADHKSMVWRLIAQHYFQYRVHIYECEACGRLLVQPPDTGPPVFASYTPEQPEAKGILKSEGPR